MDLYSIYKSAQMGDEESALMFYQKFKPKINKCSRRLNFETAETDIIIRFLELIKNTDFESLKSKCDGAVINYTNKFFDNTYMNLLSSRIINMPFIYLNEKTVSQKMFHIMMSKAIFIAFSYLIELRREIIVYRYIYKYSVQEIEQMLKISRQAVNKTKIRGIKIIRSVYTEYLEQ